MPRSEFPDVTRFWGLDPDVTFLNHGSFGACPLPVLEAQRRLRDRMERQPVRFFMRDLEGLLDGARAELGAFIGAEPQDLAFVPNATAGVNAVLRSLRIEPGDELLVTDHAYNACRNALDFAAAERGARVVIVPMAFPIGA
ncbi:MAG TPA: aminotransferase class V-fold PLP-dependent enzyme, partial [Candidatus Binatus sp.]|nr:aminotransferase class V-fold PLP-dependent enzyme [Candidatus Binatus sp.]